MKMDADLAQSLHRRSEKLSALTNLIGAEAMDRLRRRHPDFSATGDAAKTEDTGRVAWQRNRLLQKLRSDLQDGPQTEPDLRKDTTAPKEKAVGKAGPPCGDTVDSRIAAGLSLANLKHEHPAVIARVLRGLDRTARVSLLQQLPGHAARAALRRLRSP